MGSFPQEYPQKKLFLVGFSTGADQIIRLGEFWQKPASQQSEAGAYGSAAENLQVACGRLQAFGKRVGRGCAEFELAAGLESDVTSRWQRSVINSEICLDVCDVHARIG